MQAGMALVGKQAITENCCPVEKHPNVNNNH